MLERYAAKHKIKLGLAPTRRTMHGEKAFSKEEAKRWKEEIEKKVSSYGIDYVNLDFLNEEGLLFNGLDSDTAARKFIEEGVDAIFAPHCNFGCEDAVAKLAKKVNKPLLIWGPRDDEPLPDGYRLRDSQCGLFATSKVLSRFDVNFTYITNCRMEDEIFDRGFKNFLAVASAVKSFTNLRLGQISTRPNAFWSVKCNEAELLERFGVEVVPMTLPDLKKLFDGAIKEQGSEIKQIIDETKAKFKIEFDESYLQKIAALRLAIRRWAEEEQLTAAATQCWGPMAETVGISPCFVLGELTDDGLPVICEADLHGAITAVLAEGAVMWEKPIFLADVTIRHPQNDNAELFWHCGVFPKSLMSEGSKPALSNHYNRKLPVVGTYEIAGGDITIARFDGTGGRYSLLMGHGKGTSGPYTFGTYRWIEFKDWPKWEHKFIYGPYIHHVVGVHGKIAPALYEACRYIPGLLADPVEPTQEEIQKYLRG
jgi:L-fucose isomerase-like protein